MARDDAFARNALRAVRKDVFVAERELEKGEAAVDEVGRRLDRAKEAVSSRQEALDAPQPAPKPGM